MKKRPWMMAHLKKILGQIVYVFKYLRKLSNFSISVSFYLYISFHINFTLFFLYLLFFLFFFLFSLSLFIVSSKREKSCREIFVKSLKSKRGNVYNKKTFARALKWSFAVSSGNGSESFSLRLEQRRTALRIRQLCSISMHHISASTCFKISKYLGRLKRWLFDFSESFLLTYYSNYSHSFVENHSTCFVA